MAQHVRLRTNSHALTSEYSKSSLTQPIQEMGSQHESIDSRLLDGSSSPSDQPSRTIDTDRSGRKVFVGGLSPTATEDSLVRHFERFGKLEDAVLVLDKATRRSRRFGFVVFSSSDAAKRVVQQQYISMNDRLVECKIAVPEKDLPQPPRLDDCRVFLARIPADTGREDIIRLCQDFGTIRTIRIGRNAMGGCRGFAFVTFSSPQEVVGFLSAGPHSIGGREIVAEVAKPPGTPGTHSRQPERERMQPQLGMHAQDRLHAHHTHGGHGHLRMHPHPHAPIGDSGFHDSHAHPLPRERREYGAPPAASARRYYAPTGIPRPHSPTGAEAPHAPASAAVPATVSSSTQTLVSLPPLGERASHSRGVQWEPQSPPQ
eukprot:gnl/Dysnectes_brevis/2910_a3562_661.p1 GENE.gnl/Dysnectes_brevis/2910_a3562_661~~gnl/Dysnectes_brevis/2910_a3562_661.p1  ORF type:complete len:380 (-),score=61.56 gnl/Dysnectes_brevis/2910_a3562_661:656-1774(-)